MGHSIFLLSQSVSFVTIAHLLLWRAAGRRSLRSHRNSCPRRRRPRLSPVRLLSLLLLRLRRLLRHEAAVEPLQGHLWGRGRGRGGEQDQPAKRFGT
jgi:hypothetical protein